MKFEVNTKDDTILVDGILVRWSFLRMIVDPNPNIVYRFLIRDGEAVSETYALKDVEELVR